MLTTDGSIWRAIWENWVDNCTGEGTCSGVASAEGFFSLPFTPPETTVPIRMPSVRVARTTKVEAKRLALNFCLKPETCPSITCPPANEPNRNYTVGATLRLNCAGIHWEFSCHETQEPGNWSQILLTLRQC